MSLTPDLERLLDDLVAEAEILIHPLLRASRDPVAFHRFLHHIGWDLDAVLGTDPAVLAPALETLHQAAMSAAEQLIADENPDEVVPLEEAAVAAGTLAANTVDAIRALTATVDGALGAYLTVADASDTHRTLLITEISRDISDHLLVRYLATRLPMALTLARLTGLIAPINRPELYLSDTPEAADPRVRLPVQRLGVNVEGIAQSVVLPVTMLLSNLSEAAFRSFDAFMIELNALLDGMLRELQAELVSRATTLTAVVNLDGLRLEAPGILPELGGPLSVPLVKSETEPSGLAQHPALVFGLGEIRLDWDAPEASQPIDLIEGRLQLLDSFGGNVVGDPRIEIGVDLTADPVSLRFALAGALRVVTLEGRPANDIGVELVVEPTGADERFALTATAEVAGELYLPLAFPGLDGMALRIEAPLLQARVRDDDPGVRAEITVDAEALTIDLPLTLFRRARRAGDAAPWELLAEPAQLRFALVSATSAPLATVALGPSPSGPAVAALALIEPAAGDSLRLSTGPPDNQQHAIFIGLDDIDHGFVVAFEPIDWDFTAGGALQAGVAIGEARVWLPPALEIIDSVGIADARIDRHGFSGAVDIVFRDGDGNEPQPLFGVLPVQLHSLHLVLERNLPLAFELKAAFEMPWFEEWVDVTLGINDAFDILFRVESSDPAGIVLTKEELLTLTFKSAGLEYFSAASLLKLTASGGLEPLLWNADGLEWPRIDIENLTLEQDLASLASADPEPPVVRFEEAWVDLKDLATLDLFGFHFELNRIGIGYVETTDKLWIDLTGSLRLIELIPVGLGVEGFRITWPRRIYEELGIGDGELELDDLIDIAGRIEVRFDGVYLFFGVPNAVEFEGYIRFIKEAQKIGFAGDVALRVPASGLAVDAGLMVGMNFADPPDLPYPFLYVYFGILLPSGIPLGQSGLALKGAKGLFGLNVEPDRGPEQNPYYDWYKRGPIEGAHPTNKWRDQIWSIAFGAGITITTTDGKLVGVQGLLALVIPGPIIFVEGKALVFDGIFPGDGPLKALGYFDGNELTTQINIEASLELVEGVIDVNAGLEAFFDFNDFTNWHLYLGADEPMERRVHANLLKLPVIGWLFEANSYLMLDQLDADTLRTRLGAYVGFEPPAIDLVVASAKVRAVIDGEGLLTVNPFQLNGDLGLDAVVDIDAFGLTVIGVQASAAVSVQGALPLVVDATVAARVDLPVPDFDAIPAIGGLVTSALDWFEESVAELPDIPEYLQIEIPFHWEYDGPPVVEPLVRELTLGSRLLPDEQTILGVDIENAPVVPLDARPSLVFDQQMNQDDALDFGGFASGLDRRFSTGDVWFVPRLRELTLWRLPLHGYDPRAGLDEQPWQLVATGSGAGSGDKLWGCFRADGDGGMSRRVLDLWTPGPFDFLTGTVPLTFPSDDGANDQPGVDVAAALSDRVQWCDPSPPVRVCIDAKDLEKAARDERRKPVHIDHRTGPLMRMRIRDLDFESRNLRIRIRDGGGGAEPVLAAHGSRRDRSALTVRFPEPVVAVTLRLPIGSDPMFKVRARRRRPVKLEAIAARKPDPATTERAAADPCAQAVEVVTRIDGSSIEITADDWFECLQINGEKIRLTGICWITAAEARRAADRLRDCERNQALGASSGEPPMVLQSGSFYRIRVETSIELDEGASTLESLLAGVAGALVPFQQEGGRRETAEGLFRTAGPPDNLTPYVKWVSPARQSIGHYYRDDLVIRFNRSYVSNLYPDADNSLDGGELPYAVQAVVQDARGRTVRGFFHNWTKADSATLEPEEQSLHDLLAGGEHELPERPGDDILELRHRLVVRRGSDLGAADWETVALAPARGERPKWKQGGAGEVRVARLGNRGGSAYVTRAEDGSDMRLEFVVEPAPDSRGVVGAVVAFAGPGDHYTLRWHLDASPMRIELVRVRGGSETLLGKRSSLHHPGFAHRLERAGTALALSIRRDGRRVMLEGRVGQADIAAIDDAPNPWSARLGYYARSADARFSELVIAGPTQQLAPGTRYKLQLLGGEGGRPLIRDAFAAGPGPEWIAADGDWVAEAGLQADIGSARLSYVKPIEDAEILSDLALTEGESMVIGLRTPTGARPAKTRYDVDVSRDSEGCEVRVSARLSGSTAQVELARHSRALGAATRIPLRIRLVGDRLQVWIFEWEMAALTLTDQTADRFETPPIGRIPGIGDRFSRPIRRPPIRPRPVALPLVREGGLEWQVTSGAPTIRSIEIRDPALLSVDFTTSPYASFSDHLGRLTPGEPFTDSSGSFTDQASRIGALVASQRTLADARLRLLALEDRHRIRRADRSALEQAKQALVVAAADHDEGVHSFLSSFDAAHLPIPERPRAHRLATVDAVVGYLLRTSESLQPIMLASAPDAPFDTAGRTHFSLVDASTGAELPTGWIASSDGATLVLYQRAGSAPLARSMPNDELAAIALDSDPLQLSARFVRHQGDDSADGDHRLDRPYLLARSSSEPEIVGGLVLS